MKGRKIFFGILISILVGITIWTSYSMFDVRRKDESYNVSVIVNDSNNDRWIALRQGLDQAAKDFHINLNYVFTGNLNNVEEEIALMEREQENGAEGIIVQLISSEGVWEKMEHFKGQTVVILLESDIKPEEMSVCVAPDNFKMGEELADAIKNDYPEELESKKIGILCGNQDILSMQQRLRGLEQGLEGTGAEIVWTVGDGAERMSWQHVKTTVVDIMAALGNDETEEMVDYLYEEQMESCVLYGVGCSEKAVYYLDRGMIRTLVVPNEFNMGYLSMEAVVQNLRYHVPDTVNDKVGHMMVNRMNMYDAENQKALFPIVQ